MVSAPGLKSNLPPGTIDAALTRLFPVPNPHINDPAQWLHDTCGRHLWSKQVEILNSVRDNRLTAVKSCHGPGKSFSGSGAGSWWIDVHEFGSSFLVSTAPSWPQVEAILWREIRRRHREGNLKGRITMDCKWHIGDYGAKRADMSEELVAMGRKPQDYDETTFQGIHALFFMAVIDEACGIPEALWNAVIALATNENSRILALGNPDDPNSRFASICKPGSGWNTIKISVWDTPNFTGEDTCAVCGQKLPQDLLDSLVGHLWVDQARREWGEGSPMWESKVEGEFPDLSDEYLISPALLERAYQRDLPGLGLGRYAADIARMGRDHTVVAWNRDGQIRIADHWSKKDTMETAGKIALRLRSHGAHRIPMNIDIIGVGSGVFDRLREQRFNVAPFQGSSRAMNPAKFRNKRSEAWWHFRQLMEDDLIDLDPTPKPENQRLAAGLTSIKWGTDSSGRIYVETKEDMEERGLPSPDEADAVVMSTVSVGAVPNRDNMGPPTSLTADLLGKAM